MALATIQLVTMFLILGVANAWSSIDLPLPVGKMYVSVSGSSMRVTLLFCMMSIRAVCCLGFRVLVFHSE